MITTFSRGKRAWAPKTLPVRRWQARQWQTEIRTGSPVVVRESWPQLHEAVRVVIGAKQRAKWASLSTGLTLLFDPLAQQR